MFLIMLLCCGEEPKETVAVQQDTVVQDTIVQQDTVKQDTVLQDTVQSDTVVDEPKELVLPPQE